MNATTTYENDGATVTFDDEPNVRYIVMQDNDAENPLQWADVEMHVYNAPRLSHKETEPEGELGNVFQRTLDESRSAEVALSVARRYARVYFGWTVERAEDSIITYQACGYSQSDWWDIFVVVPEVDSGDAEGYAEEWEKWARGDVYLVTAERFDACELEECHARDSDHWVRGSDQGIEYMYLGGIYADDAESAAEQYREQS